ncbi:xanthine dehydrogenase small subunit [Telmatospirillum sp. J64-1]|uniref:xanthine dehydrogenase small subunit n=1 Tax=Telmatospirillum sp. J64-1 TaxID=2502183 RepID=UPI00115F0248|nr:xanthine dehydrogenase small subunit [Telmatospirillum sp. J64-1]
MRNEIRFVLNGQMRAVSGVEPHVTALSWLRADGLVGSKEGCAEGDCGACTVALGEVEDGRLVWRAVNACILLLPQLDGRHVMTVEGLRGQDGSLHPAQSLLAESHGTQCGFCTPGFAMSLFALSRSAEQPDEDEILDALAGNLCRCTGYRPILDAASALPLDEAPTQEAESARSLAAATSEELSYRTGNAQAYAPRDLDSLIRIRADHPEAWILGGGTDLGLRVTKAHQVPRTIISLAEVGELKTLTETETELVIGAALTYSRALPALARRHPDFAAMIRRIGARQVRNMGSIGGNIVNASPIGDSMPALIALKAQVELAGPQGRRLLPAEDFITGYRQTALAPGEVVAAIRIPHRRPGTAFRAYKIAKRVDQDISTVAASFSLRLEDGRIAEFRAGFGGVAAKPLRALAAERALIGRAWDETAVTAGMAAIDSDISPISDARGSAEYRREVARNLLKRFYFETTQTVEARLA